MHSSQDAEQQDYLNQAAVPEFQSYFDRWASDSQAVRSSSNCALDVAYGSAQRERLDVFPTDLTTKAPVFIFVHGGWFYFLDKGDFSYLAPAFTANRITFVSVAYPLAPHARIEQIVASIRRAVLWIHQNIARYGGDPDRLFIGGHSAGGHLATLMALHDWPEAAAPHSLIKGCCSVSGLYDLEPVFDSPHNAKIQMTRQTAVECSPVRQLRTTEASLIATVGSEELSGFHWQHRTFLGACVRAGIAVKDVPSPGKNHFSAIDQLGTPNSPLFKALLQTMKTV